MENDRRILDISIKEASDVQVLLESKKLQKQLENNKHLLKQISTTCCDCTLQYRISGNVDEMVNRIEENIKISCDTSSCNIAFKSVVEDNNDTEGECNDSDVYNEVVAEIEQCGMIEFNPVEYEMTQCEQEQYGMTEIDPVGYGMLEIDPVQYRMTQFEPEQYGMTQFQPIQRGYNEHYEEPLIEE